MQKRGYQCVTLITRACEGLPITTPHLTNGTSWVDLKTAVDHINREYVERDAKSGQRKTPLFLQGTSLGGILVARYLVEEGFEATKKVDSAALYCTPYDAEANEDYVYNRRFWGFPCWVLGQMFTNEIKQVSLPGLEKVMAPKKYAQVKDMLDRNWNGFHTIHDVYIEMDDLKDLKEYYDKSTSGRYLSKIKVPTFALSAADDFLNEDKNLPRQEVQKPDSNVMMSVAAYGTHCCFLAGIFVPRAWYHKPILEWFDFYENEMKT